MLRQVSLPKCFPVSLAQARKHLAVDSSDRSNDMLINLLIESATADSQMKTGRVWVESDWEWKPDVISANYEIAFPIVPVVNIVLNDLDEFKKPEEPEPEPETPEDGDGEEPENPEQPEDAARLKKRREAEEEEPENPEFTNLASEYLKINYPSPDPLGYPQIGSMIPLKAFPENYRLVLTVGYPVQSSEKKVEQFDNPVLVADKTGYSDSIIRLVFNRPVQGNININNFEVRIDGEILTLVNAYFRDDCVELQYTLPETPPPFEPEEPPVEDEEEEGEKPESRGLADGAKVTLSFFEGAIYDEFQNFVQPIVEMQLPPVLITSPEYFELPNPVPCELVYESLAPSPIKNWILTRVGSLYSQRTEIALRVGKSNDAMFPDQFINNLLNPYIVRFLG